MQINQYKYPILAFVGGIVVCYTIALWVENNSLKSQLDSFKNERQELMIQVKHESIREQLNSVVEMENHIFEVIVYTGLKQKEHSLTEKERHELKNIREKIGYNVDTSNAYEKIKKILNAMNKYLYECKKFMIAVDTGNANMDDSDKLIDNFTDEINKLRQTKKAESTAVSSGWWTSITSVVYSLSMWLLNMIKDLLIT